MGRFAAAALVLLGCPDRTLVVPELRSELPTPLAVPADPRELLGHEATVGDGGEVRVGAHRPGCRVRSEEDATRYQVVGRAAHRGVAYFSIQVAVGGVGAKLRGASTVEYRVENTKTVAASFEGPCGESVVRKVYVGTGTVRFFRTAAAEVGASAPVVGAAGAAEEAELLHEVTFEEAAYAVEVGAPGTGQAELRVDIDLPSTELQDGHDVEIRVYASQAAYIVLASVTEAAEAYVLLPSVVRGTPRSEPNSVLLYPTPEEAARGIRMRPRLVPGTTEARESLIAWAFLDESAFREVVPLRTAGRDYVVEPLADLEARVERAKASVAAGRVAMARREYRISQSSGEAR